MRLNIWIKVLITAGSLLWFSTIAQQATKPTADSTSAGRPSLAQLPGSAALSPLLFTDMELLNDIRKLGTGDRVTFRVIEDEEDPKSLTVTDAGEIEVPYFGLVKAADKTCRQLAREIKVLLEKDLYHQATVCVSVELVNRTRITGKVYVAGQVRSPATLDVIDGETNTVSAVILKAGGFAEFADKKKVQLVRKDALAPGGKKTFLINIEKIWQLGGTDKDVVVEAGDHVFVPTRLVNW